MLMSVTDIRVDEVSYGYEDFRYRTPIKFGGMVLDRVTLLNVECRVSTRAGKSAVGFGSMPLGNVWAFPSKSMSYETTLAAMTVLVDEFATFVAGFKGYGHPIDLMHALESAFHPSARDISGRVRLDEEIPRLAVLVCVSPFDAAIHDAFGKVHGFNCYDSYGRK